MTKKKHGGRLQALRELEESFLQHCASLAHKQRHKRGRPRNAWWRIRGGLHRPLVRNLLLAGLGTFLMAGLIIGGVWLRLMSGPIDINMAAPLLASAIEQTMGGHHSVEIGGARIEHVRDGDAAVQIQDIVIRDADGTVIANAPRAEVSISRSALLAGRIRAKRLSLVGVELWVRIEQDGQVTVSTGADQRPLAITPPVAMTPPVAAGEEPVAADQAPAAEKDESAADSVTDLGIERFSALVSWLDELSTLGFDGDGLGQIGLKDGTLKVDDQRTDKHWVFDRISFAISRLRNGGIGFTLASSNEERLWSLTATQRPSGFQRRIITIDARNVSTKDLLLAARLDAGQIQADLPFSGFLRAEIGPDMLPTHVEGRFVSQGGMVGDIADIDSAFYVDRADIKLDWDVNRRTLVAPIYLQAGGNSITLFSRFQAPRDESGIWQMTLAGGSAVLGKSPEDQHPLVLDKIMIRANVDPAKGRLEIVQGDIGGSNIRGVLNGMAELSDPSPNLAIGFAATPMPVHAAKKIWPVFISSRVRSWVMDHVEGGDVDHIDIATNAPLETLRQDGPPIPDDGLSVDVAVRNAVVRPLDGLPSVREADLKLRIKGRHAVIDMARGVVDMKGGQLVLSNGTFEIPDTDPQSPPARVKFQIEGPVQAALELLQGDLLREHAILTLNPATSKGNIRGQVSINLPLTAEPPKGSITYAMAFDITGFVAEKMLMGQAVEAQALKVSVTEQGYEVHGDVKIAGAPATVSLRKQMNAREAELRLQGTFDDAARARLGFDNASALTGPVHLKLSGKYGGDQDVRLAVDADLTQAKVDNLLPGWVKAAGKPVRATFNLAHHRDKGTRLDEIVIEGSGANLQGSAELDSAGNLTAANFTSFAFAEGDKASLRAEQVEGTLRVTLRGDMFDGRGFVKSALGDTSAQKAKLTSDMDVDVKLAAVRGFHDEVLRNVELKMSRRTGHIRSLGLSARIGRDAALISDLRSAVGSPRSTLYLESQDAGALFRFTDTYQRMYGGQMWITMDAPTPDRTPQDGSLQVRNFAIRGEGALNRAVGQGRNDVSEVVFSEARIEFTRTPGQMEVRDGVVRGPTIGATVEGQINYAKNEVRLRGTFVPLYGLNNALGQLPVVGLFLGGSNEGLVGITYEVSGPPGAPVLRVNPISAIAPGLLRKFFEFPGAGKPGVDPAGLREEAPQPPMPVR